MEIVPTETRRTVGGLTETYWFKVYNQRVGQWLYFRDLDDAVDWVDSQRQ